MTESIQVFKYTHAPSIATIREKIGNGKTIKRNVSQIHLINKNDLTELKTTIDSIKSYHYGSMGRAKFQYITKEKTADGNDRYADFSIWYHFYINKDLGILIVGGDPKQRNKVKNEISKVFNGNTSDIRKITIFKDDLLSLIKKIKSQGPLKDGKALNMMSKCVYDNADLSSHDGAETEAIKMYDSDEPKCVSKHKSFKQNFPDCETFHTIMRIYKCGGIQNDRSTKEHKLTLKSTAEFATKINPVFEHWIIFVTDVCKTALRLS